MTHTEDAPRMTSLHMQNGFIEVCEHLSNGRCIPQVVSISRETHTQRNLEANMLIHTSFAFDCATNYISIIKSVTLLAVDSTMCC